MKLEYAMLIFRLGNKHPRALTALLLCAGMSACTNQTSIQMDYTSNRDECQIMAEQNINRFVEPGQQYDPRSINAKLVTLFSDCMFERGWTVATPKREDGKDEEAKESEQGNARPQRELDPDVAVGVRPNPVGGRVGLSPQPNKEYQNPYYGVTVAPPQGQSGRRAPRAQYQPYR